VQEVLFCDRILLPLKNEIIFYSTPKQDILPLFFQIIWTYLMNYERPSYLTFSYFINEVLADSIIYMDNDQLLPDYNVQIGVVAE